MPGESNVSTAILREVMRIVDVKAFWTPKIILTAMGTWIIEISAQTTGRQTMNSTYSHTIESKIQKTPSGGM
jgi:hypothetical protein